jgi:6-phosphogluconate dehydrogenase
MGNQAAGHYVKMVHNGIEYGLMQLISEVYDFLKRGLGMSNDEMHQVFRQWDEGELQSFLLEITADIFTKNDEAGDGRLVDIIADRAGSKGTGKWTSQEAMNLPVPVPTIDMAVAMRDLSVLKNERQQAATLYKPKMKSFPGNRDKFISQLQDALFAASLITYGQGLAMLFKASASRQMEIPLGDVVRIWRGGCIIRSAQLEIFNAAYRKNPSLPNILLDKKIAGLLKKKQGGLRKMVQHYSSARIPAAALGSALAYLDAYTSERMPTNLIQAQRDYFGAHTYQRLDKEGSFHTDW